jgi:hypothetical protein
MVGDHWSIPFSEIIYELTSILPDADSVIPIHSLGVAIGYSSGSDPCRNSLIATVEAGRLSQSEHCNLDCILTHLRFDIGFLNLHGLDTFRTSEVE